MGGFPIFFATIGLLLLSSHQVHTKSNVTKIAQAGMEHQEVIDCLMSDQARQEAIARCFRSPANASDCSVLLANMECFIKATKTICNDLHLDVAGFDFYEKLREMMLHRSSNRSMGPCRNLLQSRLTNYSCSKCTSDKPRVNLTGDLKHLTVKKENSSLVCRKLKIECRPILARWSSRLILLYQSKAIPNPDDTNAPGEVVKAELECGGSPIHWLWSGSHPVDEITCISKYSLNPCSECEDSGITFTGDGKVYREVRGGCKVIRFECEAKNSSYIAQIRVNGLNLTSSLGGTLELKIACQGSGREQQWNENSLLISNITSVFCDWSYALKPCLRCQESQISFTGDGIMTLNNSMNDGCKTMNYYCPPTNLSYVSTIRLNGGNDSSQNAPDYAESFICNGTQVQWTPVSRNDINVTSLSCNRKSLFRDCFQCQESWINFTGDGTAKLINVDGCKIINFKCSPPIPVYKSYLELNDRYLESAFGGTIEVDLICEKGHTFTHWAEKNHFKIQNVTSVLCDTKHGTLPCSTCQDSLITFSGDGKATTSAINNCKSIKYECVPDSGKQSQITLNGHQLFTGGPGKNLELTFLCDGNGLEWKVIKLGITVTTASCDREKFNHVQDSCASCGPHRPALELQGGKYLTVEYGYDNSDGCYYMTAKCMPVTPSSESTIVGGKVGDPNWLEKRQSPRRGKAAEIGRACSSDGKGWPDDINLLMCYTETPEDFSCSDATFFAPYLKVEYGSKAYQLKIVQEPGTTDLYKMDCFLLLPIRNVMVPTKIACERRGKRWELNDDGIILECYQGREWRFRGYKMLWVGCGVR